MSATKAPLETTSVTETVNSEKEMEKMEDTDSVMQMIQGADSLQEDMEVKNRILRLTLGERILRTTYQIRNHS
jgi:hypothetical protein